MKTLKNILLITLISSFTFVAGASELPNVSCMSASGFYVNLNVQHLEGKTKVVAAQGFGYEISEQLGIKEGMTAVIELDTENCTATDNQLLCEGPAKSEFSGFRVSETFEGNVFLVIDTSLDLGNGKEDRIELGFLPKGHYRAANVTQSIPEYLGRCSVPE